MVSKLSPLDKWLHSNKIKWNQCQFFLAFSLFFLSLFIISLLFFFFLFPFSSLSLILFSYFFFFLLSFLSLFSLLSTFFFLLFPFFLFLLSFLPSFSFFLSFYYFFFLLAISLFFLLFSLRIWNGVLGLISLNSKATLEGIQCYRLPWPKLNKQTTKKPWHFQT